MIHYDKLVRDKIPAIIETAGKTPLTERIPPEDMQSALNRKLQEEVNEYLESHSVEEMADVLEVLHGIAFHAGIDWNQIEAERLRKRKNAAVLKKESD